MHLHFVGIPTHGVALGKFLAYVGNRDHARSDTLVSLAARNTHRIMGTSRILQLAVGALCVVDYYISLCGTCIAR